jgi:cell wall-associated NlpC family hydrolase
METDQRTRVDNAVAWATRHLGETAYASRCLAFVEDAYERSNHLEVFGGDFAGESAELYAVRDETGPPPRGAFAFYDTSGELFGRRSNWGHVGLGLGDGLIVHAWDRVRVDHYLEVQELAAPPGWDPCRWVGWAPAERVLQGCRPKDWTPSGDAAAAARRMQRDRFGPEASPS